MESADRNLPRELVGVKISLVFPNTESDQHIVQLFNDPLAMEHLVALRKSDQGGWTLDQVTARREFQIQEQSQLRGWFFIILEKSSGMFAGICGFRSIDWSNRSAEMGIILSPSFWGKGFSSEAHYLILSYAFEILHLHRIFFVTASSNLGMCRFCETVLSCTKDGSLRDFMARSWTDPSKGYDSCELYSILSLEWTASKSNLISRLDR